MVSKILKTLLFIPVFFGCSLEKPTQSEQTDIVSKTDTPAVQKKLVTKTERNVFSDLNSSDFKVKANEYIVSFKAKSPYKSDSIEFEMLAQLDTSGSGKVSRMIVNYNQNYFEIRSLDYLILTPQELVGMKDYPPVKFIDYNFDEFPDVAIHNRVASGMKNQIYDTYLFRHDKNGYYKNKFLSELTNSTLNREEKTISTFGAGGMASQIYSLGVYKWTGEKYELIRSENQSYIDSIDRYVRTTKVLIDTTWSTEIDTLRDDQLTR